MNSDALCWIDNSIKPAHHASISVFDHGLLYGDGVFEGLRFYNSVVFMLDEHLARLQQSAQAITLQLPYSMQTIKQAIQQLIDAYPGDSGYLRLVATRGSGSLGIDPRTCAKSQLFIIADELNVVDSQHAIRLFIATTRRMPAECLDPKIKSMDYLNNILARIEANEAGMDEALMLNTQGFVTEGTVDNIFIIRDRQLFTPRVSDGLLRGITRDVILRLARQIDIPTVETSLTTDDVMRAEECFLTGTGVELLAVARVNQHVFPRVGNPLLPQIQAAFKAMLEARCTRVPRQL